MVDILDGRDPSGTRSFQMGCTLSYEVQSETAFIFNVMPVQSASQQSSSEQIIVTPHIQMDEYVDQVYGNRYHRLHCFGPTFLTVQFDATVRSTPNLRDLQDPQPAGLPSDLPLDMLPYLFPSRYCQSDQFQNFAQQEFSHLPRDLAEVDAICEWVYRNVSYVLGSTGPMTTAADTFMSRTGVCRDFTHLAIAFCRALAIPARFVSGYAAGLEPPDFHALLEVWVGNRWYLFDATRKSAPEQFVRICTGRDAAEASFAFIFGDTQMTQMSVFSVEQMQD